MFGKLAGPRAAHPPSQFARRPAGWPVCFGRRFGRLVPEARAALYRKPWRVI